MGPFKNYVTARGEGGVSESITGHPNGAERHITRYYGGEWKGENFVETKHYVIFERPLYIS